MGHGFTYDLARVGRSEVEGPSGAWCPAYQSFLFHTYTMPVGGEFLGSWFHSHPVAASEMWVLDAHASTLIPADFQQCATTVVAPAPPARNNGGDIDAGGGMGAMDKLLGNRTTTICRKTSAHSYGTIAALPLKVGWSIRSMQQWILDVGNGARALRCRYRTQARIMHDEPYGRAPMRDLEYSPARCDNWRFAAGDYVTLIAFNYPGPQAEQQHQRWFSVARLNLGQENKRAGAARKQSGGAL